MIINIQYYYELPLHIIIIIIILFELINFNDAKYKMEEDI